jgi:outer membrane protein assembly factor BamE (lipoprotein component of BamABCDE complex)
MRNLRLLFLAVSLTLGLAACDFIAEKKLKVGESTIEDVRKLMGKPEMIWEEKDGSQTHEYARSPEGHQTYMVMIGADGKYKGMKNILVNDEFQKVRPGMTRDDIRRLLGKPTEIVTFKLKSEEVWSWRHMNEQHKSEMFNVHFDLDGKAKTTSKSMDPRTQATG